MSATKTDVEPVNGYFAGGNRRARQLAEAVPAIRPSKPTTARSRIAAGKTKKTRVAPMAPTAERAAQGAIATPRSIESPHRAVSLAEQLRDQKELCARPPKSRMTPDQIEQLHKNGKLDHDHRTSFGMYEAALRLQRHHEGSMIGTLKSQDLNRVAGVGASDDTIEETWVHHRECYQTVVKLMGWAAGVTVAICCENATVYEAALLHTGEARKERALAVGMDRLRMGLFTAALHWRMI